MQAILAVTIPFFALVLLGWFAARALLAAGKRDPGAQRLRAVLRLAVHAVPLRLQPAVRPSRRSGAARRLRRRGARDHRLDDRGDGAARWPHGRRDAARRRLRRARRRVPERRLHGRAAAGRAPRRERRRAGDRRDRGRPRRHQHGVRRRRAIAEPPLACRRREIDADRGALLSLRGALTNPLPWAIALGAVFAATDRELPAPLAQVVRMLGDSAAPVALFTIGSVLWRAGQHAHTETPVAHYLAGGADQAARPSGVGARDRARGATRSARRSRRSR